MPQKSIVLEILRCAVVENLAYKCGKKVLTAIANDRDRASLKSYLFLLPLKKRTNRFHVNVMSINTRFKENKVSSA